MSVLTIRIITCDGTTDGEVCPAEHGGEPGLPLADLLRTAREAGWAIRHDRRSFCPQHAKDGEAP